VEEVEEVELHKDAMSMTSVGGVAIPVTASFCSGDFTSGVIILTGSDEICDTLGNAWLDALLLLLTVGKEVVFSPPLSGFTVTTLAGKDSF